MSSHTLEEDDLAFEQRLLGAGLAEALPQERTEAALLRFAAGLAALPGGLASAAVGAPAAGSGAGAATRFFAAAKWIALGAIAGGVATFLWVQGAPHTNSAPVVHSASQPAAVAPEAAQLPGLVAPSDATAAVPAARTQPRRTTRTAGTAPLTAPSPKLASDLAAEVAALDRIRTAQAIGAWSDADLQLSRYRQDFPAGALRSEAEVLALEALLAQGHKQAAAAAAERFIAQHPRDPQVARVRAFTQ